MTRRELKEALGQVEVTIIYDIIKEFDYYSAVISSSGLYLDGVDDELVYFQDSAGYIDSDNKIIKVVLTDPDIYDKSDRELNIIYKSLLMDKSALKSEIPDMTLGYNDDIDWKEYIRFNHLKVAF